MIFGVKAAELQYGKLPAYAFEGFKMCLWQSSLATDMSPVLKKGHNEGRELTRLYQDGLTTPASKLW